MLRRTLARLYPFQDSAPDPARISCATDPRRPIGYKAMRDGCDFSTTHDALAHEMPSFGKNHNRPWNRHTKKLSGAAPLERKVSCPWCHHQFDFTYEEYRRDPKLQAIYKAHEDSHTPPPGWEPDPRPMKGKGVTQYDARHRFGWMLGEEW
eukprot:TRINITY_DN25907_c0_g1_i1.p2 TRINITY_DN25907_c0_g1~~TRINITY_DN25907_c0_g1_i1.p2  ORF type:complete len:151 (+),score=39.31 TRINITY_DN25907_c0_g1_i1:63-515(+)